MERVKIHDRAGNTQLKPCEYFDYVFGVGTGGIIAIMIGRLRMSVDDAIQEYVKLLSTMSDVYRVRNPIIRILHLAGRDAPKRKNSETFEEALQAIITRTVKEHQMSASEALTKT
ncbi:hypothetical protein MMC13_004775 [Lambiella insularis]|nr:hypothetical protein [Lambiella insularis]